MCRAICARCSGVVSYQNWSSAQTADPNLLEFGLLKPQIVDDKFFGELSSHRSLMKISKPIFPLWPYRRLRNGDLPKMKICYIKSIFRSRVQTFWVVSGYVLFFSNFHFARDIAISGWISSMHCWHHDQKYAKFQIKIVIATIKTRPSSPTTVIGAATKRRRYRLFGVGPLIQCHPLQHLQ